MLNSHAVERVRRAAREQKAELRVLALFGPNQLFEGGACSADQTQHKARSRTHQGEHARACECVCERVS